MEDQDNNYNFYATAVDGSVPEGRWTSGPTPDGRGEFTVFQNKPLGRRAGARGRRAPTAARRISRSADVTPPACMGHAGRFEEEDHMKMFTKAAVALMIAGTSLSATAQTAPPPPPPEAKTQAMAYVMASGMSDMFEITSSQIAVQKSKTPAVRSFANMMIKHHTKTTADTMKAARKAGITPPAPMVDPGAQASIAELNAATPEDFDRVYLAQQVPAHQAALDLQTELCRAG